MGADDTRPLHQMKGVLVLPDSMQEVALAILCTDLGFIRKNVLPEVLDLLKAKLATAYQRISGAGIVLNIDEFSDVDLLVSYAAWLYRGRINQTPMPEQLRWMLKNRQAYALLKEESK